MKDLSILVFTIEYSDDWQTYSENWMNCKFSDQRFITVKEGSTVGDLCKMFEDNNHPVAYMMKPYISFTAEGILRTEPTKFYDGKIKPVDKSKILDGTEVFHLIKSNTDHSNIEDFIYE